MMFILYMLTSVSVTFALTFDPQRGAAPTEEPDDSGQPGRGLWSYTAESPAGDRGCHHGHQVPEYRGGDPHPAPAQGEEGGGGSRKGLGERRGGEGGGGVPEHGSEALHPVAAATAAAAAAVPAAALTSCDDS